LEFKNKEMLPLFNLRPIGTARAVLDHYLKLSGIFITERRQGKPQRAINRQLKLALPDPLQFMLIKKEFWEDAFGLEVIGLSLWILLEAYCKELHTKTRENTDKQAADYAKKLKIALCIFLLGLKYPPSMLQFVPYESDIAADFLMVPVLPSLLLESGYFFSEFDRASLTFRPRQDFGGEGELFPWAQGMSSHKNIPAVLHHLKGF
jgi:hypothetical protein